MTDTDIATPPPSGRIRAASARTTATRLVTDTPMGPVRIAASADALVALDWCDPADLPSAARDRVTESPRPSVTALLDDAEAQLRAYLAGELMQFDLPLAPAGTDFRRAVWQSMLDIPYGETLTYGAIARQLGSVARAVGGACGANPIPIIIPCHRVVGGGSSIGGFSARGGVDTKRFLLHLERARMPGETLRLL